MFKEICKNFCPYYRPEKKEIGFCFPIKIYNNLSVFKPDICNPIFNNHFPILKKIFCLKCEFYPDDCDFNNGVDGFPCGGYIYTEYLLKFGAIDLEYLRKLSLSLK